MKVAHNNTNLIRRKLIMSPSEGRFTRSDEWRMFSYLVEQHVTNYTIPQYGDAPNDEVAAWTPEMCALAMQKYTKRFSSSLRGKDETLRDMFKIAHFACLTYWKLKERMENDT
jgi:hypothetical protein